MKKSREFLMGFVMINGAWWLLSALLHTRTLPGPLEVYREVPGLVTGGIFFHIAASLYRLFMSLGISMAAGITAGCFMARFPKVDALLHPLVYVGYPVPKTALLPAAMLLLGLGDGSKILIMVLTMVFQIVITAKDAAAGIEASLYQVGKSAGRSEWYLFRHVTFPAILPELFTGMKISLGTGLAILLIVEAYGTRAGIGYYILDAWARISYNEMYGGIVVISVMGGLLFLLADVLCRKICRWKW